MTKEDIREKVSLGEKEEKEARWEGPPRFPLSLLSQEVEPAHLASPAGYRTDWPRSPSHI